MHHFRNGVGEAEGTWSGGGNFLVQEERGGLPGGEQIADKQACRQTAWQNQATKDQTTILITTADKQIGRTEQQKTKQQS